MCDQILDYYKCLLSVQLPGLLAELLPCQPFEQNVSHSIQYIGTTLHDIALNLHLVKCMYTTVHSALRM